ncbi:MAG: beta-ketoacyl-ACP synthase II [Bacteroidales bacterium]|nr:beta-ketoacyl-ACP synthase II [Bacteroidales bacterium]MBQ8461331.1 beta-ketoacyl-ACP synthase II [Bacteroidales bacterium]
MNNTKRVVITGMGVISSVGNDIQTYWKNLKDGVCGIEVIDTFPTDNLPVKIAGKIKDFNPEEYGMDKPFVRKQDRFTQFGVAAAYQAMKDAGLVTEGEDANIDPFRLGVYVGSGIGGFEVQYRETAKMIEDPSGQWISPLFIPTMISNIAAGHIAIKHHAQGPCLDIVTACATSSHCLGEAFRAIRHGYADAIIAGGCENATIPLGIVGFANAKALTRVEDPKYASLPFNKNRQGFVMGDGAGILVLEELEHAKARGAKIYGEMVGYGNTCDAYHATAPRPDGQTQAKCITLALEEAGFDKAKDNLYINAHGTGTHLNDVAETIAYKLALGDFAYKAHISSIKSMTGHMFGAAGAAEAIATILALKDGIIPPTINLDCPDPECDLDYTPNVALKSDITLGISDSLGFGGHNACVAFRKYQD